MLPPLFRYETNVGAFFPVSTSPIKVGPEGVLRITNLSSTMKKPFEHWITF